MAYLRQLSSHFDPVYIKPANLAKAVRQLQTTVNTNCALPEEQLPARRDQDRRCGIERRRRQLPVLLDTRTSQARRKVSARRQGDTYAGDIRVGIDIYV